MLFFLRSIWNLVKYVAAQRITFTALLKGTCRGLRKKRYNNTLCFKYSLFWRLWWKFQWNFPKIQRRDYIATTAEEGWEIYHDPPDKVICTSLLWAENNNINFEVWSWSPLLLRFCFITLQRMQSPMMMMMKMMMLQRMQWADTLSLLEFPPQAIHDLRTLGLSFRIFLQKLQGGFSCWFSLLYNGYYGV